MENAYVDQRSSLLKYLIKYGRKKEVIQKIVGGLVFGLLGFFLVVVVPPLHSSMSSVTEVYQMLMSTFPSMSVWSIQLFSFMPPL